MPQYLVGPTRISPDFTTISSAIGAIPANLSGTGIHEIIIDAATYNESLTGVNAIDRIGASATDYIILRAANGSEHNGIYGNSNGVIINNNGSSITIDIRTSYTRLSNLEVGMVYNGSNWKFGIQIYYNYPANCLLNKILVKMDITGTISYGVGIGQSGAGKMYECCVWWKNVVNEVGGRNHSYMSNFGSWDCYNCVSYGCIPISGAAFLPNAANDIRMYNCACFNGVGGGQCFWGNPISKNASNDTTGNIGYRNLTAQQFGFIDPSTGNFHVNRNSFLLGQGNDQSSLFTTDIDGDYIREWMIGFDYVSPSCWSYKAKYKNSDRIFSVGGPDKYPSTLKVPKNVDISTGRMTDEDLLIDSSNYNIEQ